ncbi:uncharacterized protein LOC130743535 [Lotus japonicus]|uniref:uncharacterized protein LOC130743535 n=1 Tax=Lotus japonicus TaxID=34305 RepID=UPI00258DCF40|nr:uncharacterized protein LOC130743535 [Lotus japonicus]
MQRLICGFLILGFVSSCLCINIIHDVTRYGARGDGKSDDSHAFLSAWQQVCRAGGMATLFIPGGKTFLVTSMTTISGPCKTSIIHIQLLGNIVAPSFDAWGPDKSKWISIQYVNRLTLYGGGKIDGQGHTWWERCKNCYRPMSLSFHGCKDLIVSYLHFFNSPGSHITVDGCVGARFSHLSIHAPPNSPNTDGFDIANSRNILIEDSTIGTGDDCIAINGGSSFINATRVACGPGHGISVGSLGKHGAHDTVEEVYVYDCSFTGTQNAARIKTVPGGSGYARRITFEKITLTRTGNPIIIDQYYSLAIYGPHFNYGYSSGSTVQVSDVTYRGVHGTSIDVMAINLNCSPPGCFNLVFDNINIVSSIPGKRAFASCKNAHGAVRSSTPSIHCLLRHSERKKILLLKMQRLIIGVFILGFVSSCLCQNTIYNVMHYGAKGDGKSDDSHAFLSAWKVACESAEVGTLVIPGGKTFLVTSITTLTGPCKSSSINIQLQGNIVAPSFDAWGADKSKWISIHSVNHLTINGGGKIDGLGSSWWERCKTCSRPTSLSFYSCNGLTVSNLHLANSPGSHINVDGCNGARFSHINIQAPANSPNTDGFDISDSRHIMIQDSNIATGDDCIAINGRSTSFINATRVACGPGHGISVGSLGKSGAHETVEEVYVYDCSFTGTQNAARIKTVSGGSGYARKITFEKITLTKAGDPIIIDQYYAQEVSSGTSSDDIAINLHCSPPGCFNLVLDQINIVSSVPGKKTSASCQNAHGRVTSSVPSVPCLLR